MLLLTDPPSGHWDIYSSAGRPFGLHINHCLILVYAHLTDTSDPHKKPNRTTPAKKQHGDATRPFRTQGLNLPLLIRLGRNGCTSVVYSRNGPMSTFCRCIADLCLTSIMILLRYMRCRMPYLGELFSADKCRRGNYAILR